MDTFLRRRLPWTRVTRARSCQSAPRSHAARMRLRSLLILAVLSGGMVLAEPESPSHAPPVRTPVPLAPEAFADFIGRYQREAMTVLVFRDRDHFFIKVDDRPRVEIFPLSDHEFFAVDSPDTLSFERDRHGSVTHFVRRAAAPQLFRRVP